MDLIINDNENIVRNIFDGRRIYDLSTVQEGVKKINYNERILNANQYELLITNYKNVWKEHNKAIIEKDTMIAAVIYLADVTEENGCLCVMPGVHAQGPLTHQHDGSHYLSSEEYTIEEATPCTRKVGDVVLFSYLTPHGSYPNRTNSPRRLVLFQFRSPTDKALKDVHISPGQGMMVRGINPAMDI